MMASSSSNEISLVAVDIGNTRIKLGGYSPDSLAEQLPRLVTSLDLETTADDFASFSAILPDAPVRWVVCSVHRPAAQRLAEWVTQQRPADHFQQLTHEQLPLAIDVEQPDRVGMDRLLASLAADRLREPEQGAIIVSIGSAITVNLLSAEGHFAGGAILPGLFMAAQALAGKTDALPLVTRTLADEPPPACGPNTEAAIASGLYWGAVGAVRELIDQLGQGNLPSTNLFFTGGDGQQFAAAIDRHAVYRGDLVLLGVALVGREFDE